MAVLNWGFIQDGGTFESLMHAILYADDSTIVLFGRPGKDAGQDARSADGIVVYQAKYRQHLTMDGAIQLALGELDYIKKYRQLEHINNQHWKNVHRWVLVANILANPNDGAEWLMKVVPAFQKEGIEADYWGVKTLEGKLADHAHVSEVFFQGENRILIGLKEAHDRLGNESIGAASLENLFVGREMEMQAIKNFLAADGKRILPIVGPAGIGKSRLVYEAMVQMAAGGWRVLWALSESMSRSSQWFQLLNSNQPTCVAVDDPAELKLLAAIIEQLAPVERHNWKVIVTCRSNKAQLLRPYQNLSLLANPVTLPALDEGHSKELLKSNSNHIIPEADIHTIYRHTGGVPGWLCIVAELGNRNALKQLPQTVDDIASLYVEDCLSKFEEADRNKGVVLLRLLALWGTVCFSADNDEQPQTEFLGTQGLSVSDLSRLLGLFCKAGIVQNWGVGKRLFAIQPMLVREHVLSSWLFADDEEKYRVNSEGRRIIQLLIHGRFPSADLALRSISNLTRSRLGASQGYTFTKPVFYELSQIASNGTVIDQDQLLLLLEILGASDPESALEVIKQIRTQAKPTIEVDDVFWGKTAVTHNSVLIKLPELLFKIAAFIQDIQVAARYLEEVRQLSVSVGVLRGEIGGNEPPRKLLNRLLCESKNSHLFAVPARKIILSEISVPDSWPFVGILLECLINPERQYMEWTARWTLTWTRRALVPRSPEWELAATLRTRIFDELRTQSNQKLRSKIWAVLAESHQQFHRLVLNQQFQVATAAEYLALLLHDLTTSVVILEKPPVKLNIEEIVAARAMWSWHLEYGKSEELVALARRCEAACSGSTKWHPQDFFRFDTDEALAPETQRVAGIFLSAVDKTPFTEFFAEAKDYIAAARAGGEDMADSIRMTALADAVSEAFVPFNAAPTTPITLYVEEVLKQPEVTNALAWAFAVRICQRYLLQVKNSGNHSQIADALKGLLVKCHDKSRFLLDLYSNPHPLNTGILTRSELECLFADEHHFTERQRFILLGVFTPSHWEAVKERLIPFCENANNNIKEFGGCVALLIRMTQLTALRYGLRDLEQQIRWILNTIIEHDLDGQILGMHDFKWLREQANFHLQISELTVLIRSRIALESKPRPDSSFRILPFDFKINDWCRYDLSQSEDAKSFDEFCALALGAGYIVFDCLPKFIADMDPSGLLVATFVENHLKLNPSISGDALALLAYVTSAYGDGSAAWAQVARPFCEKAATLTREEREHVFMGLARKETGVLSSTPGEVSHYYFQVRDGAVRMRNAEALDSPLRGYREWALNRAEADLHFEQQRAEEVANG